MTILQSLDTYYHRLAQSGDVISPGWSSEKIAWCIVLSTGGEPLDVQDVREFVGEKARPKHFAVPAAAKRTAAISANFLWDKTAYALGRTAGRGQRAAQEHAAFVTLHRKCLVGQTDEGLVALGQFLAKWVPHRFDAAPFRPEMLDTNVMFKLHGDECYLHERAAARALVANWQDESDEKATICLVTGERGPAIRLHPLIKGVEGAQLSGGALVSFNAASFNSHGKKQGQNAPISKGAAFRYAAALNHLLARERRHRLRRPVGDATVVFWADVSEAAAAEEVGSLFGQLFDGDIADETVAKQLRTRLEAIASGAPLIDLHPNIQARTRFHILALSPNGARLSVRFWASRTLGDFATHLARHYADLEIDPPPRGWGGAPSLSRLLVNTVASQRDYKNIPPLLAGEVMRAVLLGTRYPLSLLWAALARLRAGNTAAIGWHAATIRAVLVRLHRDSPDIPQEGETPMSLQRDHINSGYQLGRLFAIYELAQRAALGNVKSTIRDRYFGCASAAPANVFPMIARGAMHHLAIVRKNKPRWASLIEREVEEISGRLKPCPSGIWPRSLRISDQGEFVIGYYHQRAAKLSSENGKEYHVDDCTSDRDTEE